MWHSSFLYGFSYEQTCHEMPYSPGSVYGESLVPDPPGSGLALTAFPASDRGLRVPVQWNIVPVHISVRLSYAGVTGLQEAGARRMKNMVQSHILWGKTLGKGFGRVYRFCQIESNTVVSGRFECLSRCGSYSTASGEK